MSVDSESSRLESSRLESTESSRVESTSGEETSYLQAPYLEVDANRDETRDDERSIPLYHSAAIVCRGQGAACGILIEK